MWILEFDWLYYRFLSADRKQLRISAHRASCLLPNRFNSGGMREGISETGRIHRQTFNVGAISFPELRSPWPAVGKRELWEQPFQACAIACHGCSLRLRSEPDNQNPVISIVISKRMLPELSFSDRWSRGTKLWERDWCWGRAVSVLCATSNFNSLLQTKTRGYIPTH